MRFPSVVISATIMLQMPDFAHAAHPLVTDDTSTQGLGNHQVEINTDRARDAGDFSQTGAFTYSYGSDENLDFYGNLPFAFIPASGIGDVSLGAKWRFAERQRISIALKPELSFATGNASRGLGTGRTSGTLTLLLSHRVTPWAFHANLGLSAYRYSSSTVQEASREVVWRASTAVAYSFNARWTVVADTGIARNIQRTTQEHPMFFLVGAIYSPAPNIDLDVGVKVGLNAPEVDNQLGAGLTVRF